VDRFLRNSAAYSEPLVADLNLLMASAVGPTTSANIESSFKPWRRWTHAQRLSTGKMIWAVPALVCDCRLFFT
jgi:hypothetical protein